MNLHPYLNAYVMIDAIGDPPCQLVQWQSENSELRKYKAVYWPEGWRDRLCRCPKCQVVLFILFILRV